MSLGYSDILLFSGFALDTQKGMLLTMVGANRKEKTTSDEIMLGLHKPMAGGIYWSNGQPAEIEYLAQAYDLTFLPPSG